MLEQKVYDFITKYQLIEDDDRIVLGVSGGPDSICLLNILHEISQKKLIDFEILVCHVNHGLRENAILDETFVADFCEKRNLKFFACHANIEKMAKQEKRGLEETGRKVRYQYFDQILIAENANKIAIAHNKNDNVETIMMNILRGTGMRGLIGMEAQNGKYIRPLIEIERQEIEAYLKEKQIVARCDETNDENIYTRNKIRNVVLPYIQKEFNPNFMSAMERLSEIAKENEEYLNQQTEEIYQEICIGETNITADFAYNKLNNAEIIIDLKKFNSLEKVMQKRVILYAITKIFGWTNGIEKIHIEDIIKLCNNNIGNKYLTPNKNMKIVTQKKQLKITSVTC